MMHIFTMGRSHKTSEVVLNTNANTEYCSFDQYTLLIQHKNMTNLMILEKGL